jgi:hypothetical protein
VRAATRWKQPVHRISKARGIERTDPAPITAKALVLAQERLPGAPLPVKFLLVIKPHSILVMYIFPISQQRISPHVELIFLRGGQLSALSPAVQHVGQLLIVGSVQQ